MKITIRRKFSLVFTSLIILPALVLGLATLRLVRGSLVERMEREQLLHLQSIKSNVVDRHVQDMENALRALAKEPRLLQVFRNAEARNRVLSQWELSREMFPERSYIYYGTQDNRIVVSPSWKPPAGYDLTERPWFEAARYADGLVWVDPYVEYLSGDVVMSAVMPIFDSSRTFRGVLGIDTNLERFLNLLRRDAGKRSLQIVAVSGDGETLMLNEQERELLDMAALPEWDELSRLNNDGRYIDYKDASYYAVLVDVPRLRLKLVSLLPTSIVYEEIRPILWTTIGVAAGFIVIALAAGLFLAHDFVGNIERLNRYMEAVESGDYRVRYCVSGSDEFAQLNARLNTMVHHLAESIQSLQVESNTDALCEIYNRRYLMDRLAEYLGTLESTGAHDRCTAGHRTLSVALFDADHFKSVNDAHGHTTGDDVLRRISRILSHSFPPPATAGRFGGEEFMVLLPGISYQAACERAEEFRSMLEAQAWREHDLVITISGGVAEARVTDDPESLIHRADQALYRAKRNGRNRIACWANC